MKPMHRYRCHFQRPALWKEQPGNRRRTHSTSKQLSAWRLCLLLIGAPLALLGMASAQHPAGSALATPRAQLGFGNLNDIALWQGQLYSAGGAGLVVWSAQAPDTPNTLNGQLIASAGLQSVSAGSYGIVAGNSQGQLLLWSSPQPFQTTQISTGGLQLQAHYQAHDGAVRQVRSMGEYVASAGDDGSVALWRWSAQGLCLLRRLQGHEGRVYTVAFSPDGQLLASGGRDGRTVVWELASGQQRVVLPSGGLDVLALSFSPDSRELASGSFDGNVRMWELASGGRLLWQQKAHSRAIRGVHATAPGIVHSVGEDGQVMQVQAGAAQALQRGAHGGVALASDGTMLYVADEAGTLYRLAQAQAGQASYYRGHSSGMSALVHLAGGNVVGGDLTGALSLWAADARLLGRQTVQQGGVFNLVVSPDGRYLASGGQGREIYLWDVAQLQQALPQGSAVPLFVLEGHLANISALRFSPDGRQLASGSVDKSVRIWDVVHGQQLALLEGSSLTVSDIAFSPDGQSVWASSKDGGLRRWSLDGSLLQEVRVSAELGQGQAGLEALITLSNGEMIVSVDATANSMASGLVRVSQAGQVMGRLETAAQPSQNLTAGALLSITPSGFVSAERTGLVTLWSVGGQRVGGFVAHQADLLSMAASQTELATGSRDGTIKLWSLVHLPAPAPPSGLDSAPPRCESLQQSTFTMPTSAASVEATPVVSTPIVPSTTPPAAPTYPQVSPSSDTFQYTNPSAFPLTPSLIAPMPSGAAVSEAPEGAAWSDQAHRYPTAATLPPVQASKLSDAPLILQARTNQEIKRELQDWLEAFLPNSCVYVQVQDTVSNYIDFVFSYTSAQDCSNSGEYAEYQLRVYNDGQVWLQDPQEAQPIRLSYAVLDQKLREILP